MIQKLHFDTYYLLQPFRLDSEGREDLTANISQAFLKFILGRKKEEGARLKTREAKMWTRRNDGVWYRLIKKRCKGQPRLRRGHSDVPGWADAHLPTSCQKMTLPPSDTVGRSCTNDSGESSPGCSARPDCEIVLRSLCPRSFKAFKISIPDIHLSVNEFYQRTGGTIRWGLKVYIFTTKHNRDD